MNRNVWNNNDSNLPLVNGDASWRFIHDFSGFQSYKGVFLLADASHHIKYVGHTQNNFVIEAIANAIENGKNNGATLVKVLYTKLDKEAQLLAKIFTEKYKPENNFKDTKPEKNIITGTNKV
jgi:hypothetical protein